MLKRTEWESGERKRDREKVSTCSFIPQMVPTSKTRSQELLQVSHVGGRGPDTWDTSCCFSQLLAVSRIRSSEGRMGAHTGRQCQRWQFCILRMVALQVLIKNFSSNSCGFKKNTSVVLYWICIVSVGTVIWILGS